MNDRAVAAGAMLILASSSCITRVVYAPAPAPLAASPPAPPAIDEPGWADRVLPGVVLILNHRPDGTTLYGAGILIDDRGGVLTSTHVVAGARALEAMLYDPRRTSYTALDGGLSRYLEENRGDVLGARLERSDPELDLAVVRVAADTTRYPKLELGREAPRAGERVLALGHPGESVWSVTSGIVSSLHQGAIQHDAAIHDGNSGGPLIDARGRVVGINTARLVNGAERVGFARPIAMARHLLEASPGGAGGRAISSPGR